MSSTPQKIPLPKRDSRNIHKHDKVFISPSEKKIAFLQDFAVSKCERK